jgi:hypothetical protein
MSQVLEENEETGLPRVEVSMVAAEEEMAEGMLARE